MQYFLANMELIWPELDDVGSGYISHVHQEYVLQPKQKSISLTLYCGE